MTRVVESLEQWRQLRRSASFPSGTIGFVPTMGNLHAGHLSLIRRALEETDLTVVSIFVNPTQFDDPDDLEAYPRTLEADRKTVSELGIRFLLLPRVEELYPDDFHYRISETELSRRWCGRFRPGHFDGVLTVVLKLLELVRAERAYFGEKDYQQYLLIKGMAEAFFLQTEIVPCPIVRDADGLALSSRNSRLSGAERRLAARFPQILSQSPSAEAAYRGLEQAGFEVDYVEDFDQRRLGAVRLGETRLIDNVIL